MMLVSQIIRTAIAGLALGVTWEALQERGWNEETLAALQHDWEVLDLTDALEKGMVGERAFGEAAFSYVRTVGPAGRTNLFWPVSSRKTVKDYLEQFLMTSFWQPNEDEMLFLEYHQRLLDAIRKVRTGTPWPTINAEIATNRIQLMTVLNRPLANIRYSFSTVAIAYPARAGQTCIRHETQRRLTVAAIALERYRLRHGQMPEDLEALVPEVLRGVPLDPMSAKPLCYRLIPVGSFRLYSVGEDGTDDGGDAKPSTATNSLGLWLGKDVVWPSPARQ